MNMNERMKNGLVYFCNDDEILKEQTQCLEKLYDYNSTRPSETAKRNKMLKEMFCKIGENCYIEPPFHANWGGKNVCFGNNVYANFNLTLVDDGEIIVGNNVMFGPNVTVATAGHPVEPFLREKSAQFNLPVKIGNNVWIGAGSVILPGVNIGDNTVIGAGSLVTKDIPSDVVAFGSPCKVIRNISDKDKEFYNKDKKIDWENLI